MFVIDKSKNERIVKCLENINISERPKLSLSLNDLNRYQCRYEGCQKSFAKYDKGMKDHNANHNPLILEIVEQSVIIDTTLLDEK